MEKNPPIQLKAIPFSRVERTMSLSRIVRSFRRPLFATALLAAGLVTAAGMTNPAQAQYYPYYAGYPYYSYGYAYPYYAGYPYYGYGWGHRHWGYGRWG